MIEERDKFLTEAMGECWHEGKSPDEYDGPIQCEECSHTWRHELTCQKCGEEYDGMFYPCYSDWSGFGKLWEWAQRQKWWISFKVDWWGMKDSHLEFMPDASINPDRFADAIYTFLRERK